MKMFQEFKKFALRGNMVDLAIGFTVGAAFTTVVKSLVNDVLMPPIGLITGNADFSDHFWVLNVPDNVTVPDGGFPTLAAAQAAGAVTLNYGLFVNSCIALVIVALAMFLFIRLFNRLDEEINQAFPEPPVEPSTPVQKECEYCRTMIPALAVRCPHCTSNL